MNSSADLVRLAKSGHQQVPASPRKRAAIVTCVDTRIDPLPIFGGVMGDFHIIRNAGGVVTDDVVRSLIISTHLFPVNKVKLLMHTDCGMLRIDQAAIEEDLGPLPFDLGAFDDVEEELERGAALLRSQPLLDLPGGVSAYIYNVTDGTLRER